jgi:hypothetical protein
MKLKQHNRRTLLMVPFAVYRSVYRLPRNDMQEHRPAAHVGKETAKKWRNGHGIPARGSTRAMPQRVDSNMACQELQDW